MMNRFKHFYSIFLPAIIVLLFITYACQENSTTADVNTNEIAGQILDEQDIAVPGAVIQVFSAGGIQGLIDKDTTDEDGFFKLSGIPEKLDNLKMRIDHDDFAPFEVPLTEVVKDKDSKKIGVKLLNDTACQGILEIYADNLNDEAIQDVEIRLNRGDKIIRKAYTKENGKFIFEHVCDGEYWVRMAKDGYKVIEENFTIENGETKSLNFEMQYAEDDSCCAGIINFTVLDSLTGEPVENIKARLWKGSTKIRESFTNSDGKLTFERICDGEFQISFFKEGYHGDEFNFAMDCSDTLNITRQILKKSNDDSCCNGVVYIFVKDSAINAAIPNVLTKLWKDGKIAGDGKTSESGLVTFGNLCGGKYGFSLHHEKYGAREFNLELKCNDTIEIHQSMLMALEDTCCDGQIELTVKDKESKELLNNVLAVLWKNGKLVTKKHTEAGTVKFTDLCSGTYFMDLGNDKYHSIEFEVKVECNQKVNLTKELELKGLQDSCCDGVVILALKDKESGKIIKGAKVKLWHGDKIVYQETTPEEPLVISNLCAGKYQFTFIAEGYQSKEEDFTLECNDTLEFPFYMQKLEHDTCCNNILYIIPKDSTSGEILNGAKIKMWLNGKVVKEGIVKDGKAVIDGICKGSYGVDVILEGYKSIEFHVEFDCGEVKTITRGMLKLEDEPCCDGKINVLVKDIDNGDVIHCTIKISKDGKLIAQKNQEGGDGVVFTDLCEGKYHIVVISENYEATEFDYELGCDEVKSFIKQVKKKNTDCCKGNLHISVKDSSNNNALQGIFVKLMQNDQKKAYGTTTDGGNVKLINICQGNYVITLEGEHHYKREIPITIGCNDTLELNYKMLAKEAVDTCNTAEIYLVVTEFESDVRVPGATIKIYDLEGHLITEGTTNENGVFVYSSLKAPKKYKIRAWKDGYDDPYLTVEWTKCETKEAEMQLKKQ